MRNRIALIAVVVVCSLLLGYAMLQVTGSMTTNQAGLSQRQDDLKFLLDDARQELLSVQELRRELNATRKELTALQQGMSVGGLDRLHQELLETKFALASVKRAMNDDLVLRKELQMARHALYDANSPQLRTMRLPRELNCTLIANNVWATDAVLRDLAELRQRHAYVLRGTVEPAVMTPAPWCAEWILSEWDRETRNHVLEPLIQRAAELRVHPPIADLPIRDGRQFAVRLAAIRGDLGCSARKNVWAYCSVVVGESFLLQDWVSHHSLLGVQKFFVYDNAHPNSTQSQYLHEALRPFSDIGVVEIVPWFFDGAFRQVEAHDDCFFKHRDEYDFISVGDVDEFLVAKSPVSPCFGDVLRRRFMHYSALVVPSRTFSPIGVPSHDTRRTSVEQYRFPGELYSNETDLTGFMDVSHMDPHDRMNSVFYKSIIRTTALVSSVKVHVPTINGTAPQEFDGTPAVGTSTYRNPDTFRFVELRHYSYRSWEFAIANKLCADLPERRQWLPRRIRDLPMVACRSMSISDQETQHDEAARRLLFGENFDAES